MAAGPAYHVILDIDLRLHRYDVTVQPPSDASVVLASQFAFRTEQASVAALDHIGYFVDSPGGGLYVCDPTIAY